MRAGGHGHAGGRGQSTKKEGKKKRNELLVFVLLPQQHPSCTKLAAVAKGEPLLESLLPGQRDRPQARAGRTAAGGKKRLQELWGWWPPAPSVHPARVRRELAAPLPQAGAAMAARGAQRVAGPEPFPESSSTPRLAGIGK